MSDQACRSCGLDTYNLLDGFCAACLPDLQREP